MGKEKSEESAIPHFILIDDDPINNIICSRIIKASIPHATVQAFTDPEKGLVYIQSTYAASHVGSAVLFLDINMPSLTGWDVLDRFKNFSDCTKEHVKIFMLSSSVSTSDKEKAKNNLLISGYISKPLSGAALHSVVPGYTYGALGGNTSFIAA